MPLVTPDQLISMAPQGRLLALDLGGARVGVALSDATRLVATPLATIPYAPWTEMETTILPLLQGASITGMIIGMPLSLRGHTNPQCDFVRRWSEEAVQHTSLPLCYMDERFSTDAAHRALKESSLSLKKRNAKVNQVAASHILQSFLDWQHLRQARG